MESVISGLHFVEKKFAFLGGANLAVRMNPIGASRLWIELCNRFDNVASGAFLETVDSSWHCGPLPRSEKKQGSTSVEADFACGNAFRPCDAFIVGEPA